MRNSNGYLEKEIYLAKHSGLNTQISALPQDTIKMSVKYLKKEREKERNRNPSNEDIRAGKR